MSNTFDKLSVLDLFIEEVNSYLPEIETNLERLTQSPGDMDALEETYRRTHTIGGSASMMDFPGLAHVAHGMEDILGDALDGLVALDDPTRGLLQRSLGRLRQLLEGIRGGIDEEAVIAEDDADYAGYRTLADNASDPAASGVADVYATNSSQAQAVSSPFSPASSMPSFDEVLASFRTQPTIPGEDVGWPEEPALGARFDNTSSMTAIPAMPVQLEAQESASAWPEIPIQETPTSAFETLMAATRRPLEPPVPVQPDDTPSRVSPPDYYEMAGSCRVPSTFFSSQRQAVDNDQHYAPQMSGLVASEKPELALPQAYDDMQRDVQSLETQAGSLKSVAVQLRDAMTVIEAQRSEFKGFLNGSKDALDRMEEWAGKAMGLNLRNSPEQVRRYLPLSVMWVSNSKLKKVFDLIQKITGGVELTDEQLTMTLEQLQASLQSYGEAFESNARELRSENGWSPWNVRVDQDANALRERVTFERQGDPSVLRAEVEAQVREEVRREYEAHLDATSRERAERRTANP